MSNIVVNTEYEGAAQVTLIDEMIPRLERAGHTVTRNDWERYGEYDVAIFMSKDSRVREAKRRNPKLVTLIMDPKLVRGDRNAENRAADLLVVTSIEQRDALLPLNTSIFVYHSFPRIEQRVKQHTKTSPTILAYHGNKEHLQALDPTVTKALTRLAGEHPIELWAVYNYERLGKWRHSLPSAVLVRHIQWTPDVYEKRLMQADIGICNNHLPVPHLAHLFARSWFKRPDWRRGYAYRPNDYVVRYKYSSNPSRIYPFAQFGIPVVSDFIPSASQVIRDGDSGFIVNGSAGWYWAFKRLVQNPALRTRMGRVLADTFQNHFNTDDTFARLNEELATLVQQAQ